MTGMHVGDIGTVIAVTVTDADSGVAIDVSGATAKVLLFRKPSRATVQKAAAFATDGSDGALTYTFVAGDLDESGSWLAQAFVELPAGTWYSGKAAFVVDGNIATVG